MAHGRDGSDIVMATRYAGASEIRQMSDHEENRTPDGSSAIDETRTHLNAILYGPATQQSALEKLWNAGVGRPTAQAERPYVQTVISASPSFFRDAHQGPGQWNENSLKAWVEATMAWLKTEYEADLAHVALHLDEDTPHLHILIAPTYERKPRRPGKPAKNETLAEFEARVADAEAGETKRTVSRSSNDYWSKISVRHDARKSYHAAVAHLGIGYGRDYIAEGKPSPKNKKTALWVREEAARVAEERALIVSDRAALDVEVEALDAFRLTYRTEAENIKAHQVKKSKAIADERLELTQMRASIDKDRQMLSKVTEDLEGVLSVIDEELDITLPEGMVEAVKAMQHSIRALSTPDADITSDVPEDAPKI
tara:strand:+ start:10784 stop:11890 length:1107 start_codon:yes stop_codon:yes gene_type:complete